MPDTVFSSTGWASTEDLETVDQLQEPEVAAQIAAAANAGNGVSNILDFNAACDGTTDDTALVQAALTAAQAAGVGVVTTPPNCDIKITSQVTVPTGVTLRMADGASFVYYGSGTAVQVEPGAPDDAGETYAAQQLLRAEMVVRVKKAVVSWHDSGGNLDTSSVGVKLYNQRYSKIVLAVEGFHTNIQLLGYDSGYSAGGAHVGNVYTIYTRNSKTHVLEVRNGATGYVNQNTWVGGLIRNDGSFTASGTIGFDGSAGANGWTFVGVNAEGSTIGQVFKLGGPKNVLLGVRFETASAGMVKILATGGAIVLGGYIASAGISLFDVDAGGSLNVFSDFGSWVQNGLAANACFNAKLSGASGTFLRAISSSGVTLSELSGGDSTNAWEAYTTAGKYDATTNPAGLVNPIWKLNFAARSLVLRPSNFAASVDGSSPTLSWSDGTYLTLSRYGFSLPDATYSQRHLQIKSNRIWVDAQNRLRTKASSASSDTDGDALQTTANGATGARPASPSAGQQYFDTTLGKPIWYSGSAWVDATGASV